MAKRDKQQKRPPVDSPPMASAAVEKIEEFAGDVGQLVGQARGKAENWLAQRQSIVKNLVELRDTASRLLTDLGHQAHEQLAKVTGAPRKAGRQKKTSVVPTPAETRKRVMSPESRHRASDEQKAHRASLNAKSRR